MTESDLLPDISQEELDGIAKELVVSGDPEPIATTLAEQARKVVDYTAVYTLPDERFKRLARPLVLHELYSRLGSIPEKRKRKYDEAMKELADIRDGKFKDLPAADPLPSGADAAQGAWGSSEKII